MHLSNVSSRYGAPMGRDSEPLASFAGRKLTLARVRMVDGGYDSGGAYWGIGAPLYCVECSETGIRHYLRACDRNKAKSAVLAACPTARFFR